MNIARILYEKNITKEIFIFKFKTAWGYMIIFSQFLFHIELKLSF